MKMKEREEGKKKRRRKSERDKVDTEKNRKGGEEKSGVNNPCLVNNT